MEALDSLWKIRHTISFLCSSTSASKCITCIWPHIQVVSPLIWWQLYNALISFRMWKWNKNLFYSFTVCLSTQSHCADMACAYFIPPPPPACAVTVCSVLVYQRNIIPNLTVVLTDLHNFNFQILKLTNKVWQLQRYFKHKNRELICWWLLLYFLCFKCEFILCHMYKTVYLILDVRSTLFLMYALQV